MNKQRNGKKTDHSILNKFILILLVVLLTGCSSSVSEEKPLDSKKPISVTLWHYYSGPTKSEFDRLVTEFNNTVGTEKGIVVDAQSQGDIGQLETAVFDAASHKIGAQRLPDIFAAYPDNAYRMHKIAGLVNIETYFSKDEILTFRQDFLEEGRFGEDNKLKIVPIAKSTENLFLNKTIWDKFAKDTGADLNSLSTWEGIIQTAESYYKWSGGKAFLGIDSLSNYMLISSMQLGEEMFDYSGDNVKLNFNKTTAQKIWDSYYIPHMKGYFAKSGRFSSDDAKVGTVIAYIGSTAGAVYFPTEVTLSKSNVLQIESLALPYPHFKNRKAFAAQQGAGMVIAKSDKAHEYAAAEFLKWVTDKKQNIDFAVSTAYFPVKKEALNKDAILSVLNKKSADNSETVTSSIKTTLEMFDKYTMYGYKPFEGSFEMRNLLHTNLLDQAHKDLESLADNKLTTEEKAKKLDTFISNDHFDEWYQSFMKEAQTNFK